MLALGKAQMSKPVEVINMSGQKLDVADLERGDYPTVLRVAGWITQQLNSNVVVSTTDDGVFVIDYALDRPGVRVYDGRVIWPKGSDAGLLDRYLKKVTAGI